MALRMNVAFQEWPFRQTFRFVRQTQETAPLFVCHISDGDHVGRGECGLQSLKNETPDQVRAQLLDVARRINDIGARAELNREMPAGSARNAVDCAFWDLECKSSGKSIWS